VTTAHRWLASVPAMRAEPHFGDRTVNCFAERPRSVHALFADAAARFPVREALVDGARRWTWAQLEAAARATAAGLRRRGIAAGERVVLLLRNRAEFVIACAALARMGAVAVPVSVRSAPPEVDFVCGQCGAAGAIAEDDLMGHVPAPLRLRVPVSQFDALASGDATDAAPVDEEDTAVILYTSGTTGRPKGAMLTHLNIVHSALHYAVCMGLTEADRSIVAVPLSHVTGLVAQMHTMAAVGGALVLVDGFKAPDFLPLAAREHITHTVMVPAMYSLCLLQDDFARHDLSSWRIGAYGGAPMAPATIAQLAEKLPALTLLNCYGATETASPTTVMPPGHTARRPDSVGVAVPCGALRIVGPDGATLPPGETGEVWIHGPMVVRGYWDNPEATASNFTDGWWHSGDLGRLDADGYLEVLDRLKDVINRGGYKVFSSEVEAVLAQHPAVVESAVVGYACPVLGERVHAFVSLRDDASEAALAAHCAARLADYKIPERWTLGRDPLPRNANGKLMKRPLRETAASLSTTIPSRRQT
jgi:long-chain acyl-CoA synthetase